MLDEPNSDGDPYATQAWCASSSSVCARWSRLGLRWRLLGRRQTRSKLALGSGPSDVPSHLAARPTRALLLHLLPSKLASHAYSQHPSGTQPASLLLLINVAMLCYDAMRCLPDRSRYVSDDCVRGGAGNALQRQRGNSHCAAPACIQPPARPDFMPRRPSCLVRLSGAWLACVASATTLTLPPIRLSTSRQIVLYACLVNTARLSTGARPTPAGQKNHHPRRLRLCNFAWLWRQPNWLGCFPHALALPRRLATPPSSLHAAHHMLSTGPRRQLVAMWMLCIALHSPHTRTSELVGAL